MLNYTQLYLGEKNTVEFEQANTQVTPPPSPPPPTHTCALTYIHIYMYACSGLVITNQSTALFSNLWSGKKWEFINLLSGQNMLVFNVDPYTHTRWLHVCMCIIYQHKRLHTNGKQTTLRLHKKTKLSASSGSRAQVHTDPSTVRCQLAMKYEWHVVIRHTHRKVWGRYNVIKQQKARFSIPWLNI